MFHSLLTAAIMFAIITNAKAEVYQDLNSDETTEQYEETQRDDEYLKNITSEKNVYLIPFDVKCRRTKDKRIKCTDVKGTQITGKLIKYREGKIIRIHEMKEGFLEGKSTSYPTRSNQKFNEKIYKKGVLNGTETDWYPSGQIENQIPYVNGVKEGVVKNYWENGKIKIQGIYIEDMLYGKMRTYTIDGKIAFELEYEANVPVSGKCAYYKIEKCDEKCQAAKLKGSAVNEKTETSEEGKPTLTYRELTEDELKEIGSLDKSPSFEILEEDCNFIE